MKHWPEAYTEIERLEESPVAVIFGQMYYNTIVQRIAYFNGDVWIAINDAAYNQIDLFNDLNSPRIQ